MVTSQQLATKIRLLRPIQSRNLTLSQRFGEHLRPIYGPEGHTGLDMPCYVGTPILAPADGVVTVTNWGSTGYGYEIRLESKQFEMEGKIIILQFVFGHCSRIIVKRGQRVVEGQIIGYSGSTGNSTGPHLHFEVLPNYLDGDAWVAEYNQYKHAVRIDPLPLFENNVDTPDFLINNCTNKYGFPKNQWKEWWTRFKTPAVHKALLSQGREALSLTNEELNAICYGGWSIQDIINEPTLPTYWSRMTKTTYHDRAYEFIRGTQRNKV